MEVYKDNIIVTEAMFKFLSRLEPTIAMNMIRNRIVIISTSDKDRLAIEELNSWVRENCDGLVYAINKSSAFRDHYVYQFEKDDEAVAFKIRWT